MLLSVPSKTFLSGEYNVLFGGSSLIINTEKRFFLEYTKSDTKKIDGIKRKSPAGRLISMFPQVFSKCFIKFHDNYSKSGGFGASSAQFVMCYKVYSMLTGQTISIPQFLKIYKICASNNDNINNVEQSISPSGADCVSQFIGNITYFNSKNNTTNQLNWPFEEFDFLIFKTLKKTITHRHLLRLRKFDTQLLELNTLYIYKGLISKNINYLSKGITGFYHTLKSHNLVSNNTKLIIKHLKTIEGFVAAKGCGALGSDTIIVIVKKEMAENFITSIDSNVLSYCASSKNLSNGLMIQ